MSEHSPAPWRMKVEKVRMKDNEIESTLRGERVRILSKDGRMVCGMGVRSSRNLEEKKTNGRLIRSAPDLLDALRDIARGPLQEGQSWEVYSVQKAKAAIAQFEGDT